MGVYHWVIKASGFVTDAQEFRGLRALDALTPSLHLSHDNSISGRSLRGAFVAVTSLFFMWGFITVLVDALIPRLKDVFELTFLQAGLGSVRVVRGTGCCPFLGAT